MAQRPLTRLRKLCLALPEAHEVTAWGTPTFRIRNKMFAMFAAASKHRGYERPAVWIKSTHTDQKHMVEAAPECFFVPPYVGPSGWVGVWLDGAVAWDDVDEFLKEGYKHVAPDSLVRSLEEADEED
jgi:hypothetical protein